MQQGIQENDRLWLRFKYYTFYDIEPKVCVGVCVLLIFSMSHHLSDRHLLYRLCSHPVV